MRFLAALCLLLVLGCTAHEPNVPTACWDGTSKARKCARTYKRVERAFYSKPRWGIWTEPFHYFLVREPGHRFHVQRARSHLAQWGNPEAGAHAAAELTKVGAGYKYDALEDLYTLGPLAREWLPEVRAFHQRHKGERWGLDVLTLVRMGAPEGPDLLREGLRSGMNPEPYLHARGSGDIYRAFREELMRLHENDPRYGVRLSATFALRGLMEDNSYPNETIVPPTCFSNYVHNKTTTTLAWEDSTLTLDNFPYPQASGGLCDHAPWQGKPWVKHVELLGECAVFYQQNVHPGHVAIYPRDREPYTLFEEHQGLTVLN